MDVCPFSDKTMTNTTDHHSNFFLSITHRRHFWAALVALLAISGTAAGQQQQHGDLTVLANGFTTQQGHAIARLFLPGSEVTKKGTQEVKATIHNGESSFVFTALPAGDYAVVVFHDANDNDTVDHNLIGLPVEALGFSNGFRPGPISGMPNFRKLRFTHADKAQTIELNVK